MARGEARLCWAARSKSSTVWICPPLCFRQNNSRIDPARQISSQSQASAFRLRLDGAIQAAQDVRRGAADGRRRELRGCIGVRARSRSPRKSPPSVSTCSAIL